MRVNYFRPVLNSSNGRTDVIIEKAINYTPEKVFDSPDKINIFCRDVLQLHKNPEEHAYIFCFDTGKHLIGIYEIAHGANNVVNIAYASVFAKALLVNAAGIIFVHNHPGMNVGPSQDDCELIERLWKIGAFVGVTLIDAIIIEGIYGINYYSFLEHGDFIDYKEIDIYA